MTRLRPAISIIAALAALIATPPGARAATPINACGTVIKKSGSYIVTRNLTPKAGSKATACLVVQAGSVMIDLGGFNIDCGCKLTTVGCPDGVGSGASSPDGIILRNGTITGCSNGVDLFFASSVLIESLLALSNQSDGILLSASDTVLESIANDNGKNGMEFSFCALTSALANTSFGNSFHGIVNAQGGRCEEYSNWAQ